MNFQKLCVSRTPESEWDYLYSAIVCGLDLSKNIQSTEYMNLLKQSGLYHLIVVSGGHLVFLAVIIESVFKWVHFYNHHFKFLIRITTLILFVIMTGASPPAVRSMILILLLDLCIYFQISIEHSVQTFLAGIGTLLVVPDWISSRSLLLSWSASLGLSWVPNFSASPKNWFLKCLSVYLLTSWILIAFTPLSLQSLLFNFALTPLIGGVIFPMSLLCYIIPSLTLVTDNLYQILFWILKNFVQTDLNYKLKPSVDIFNAWMIILTMHLIVYTSKIFIIRHCVKERKS